MLLDPIYSLAAWEEALHLVGQEQDQGARPETAERLEGGKERIVMLHTGGGLGLQGLAQRFPKEFIFGE